MLRASSTAPGSAATASAAGGRSGTPGVNPCRGGRTADGGPFSESGTCIRLPRNQLAAQNPPARRSVPTGNVPAGVDPASCPHHALHQVGDILGSNQTLHHAGDEAELRRGPCTAVQAPSSSSSCHGAKIICLSRYNIPLVARERGGAGWAGGERPPVAAGSGAEDLFILEQGRGRGGGEPGTLNRYRACFLLADTITDLRHRFASSFSWHLPAAGDLTQGLRPSHNRSPTSP